MPELITPPRRSSASAAIRPSSAGSNGAAVRVIRTPSLVVMFQTIGRPRWPLGFQARDDGRTSKSDRRFPGRSLLSLSAIRQAAYWRRHH